MLIKSPRDWELPERLATPESAYCNRRTILKAAGIGLAGSLLPAFVRGEEQNKAVTGQGGVPLNPDYDGQGLDITKEDIITGYNNFYEFGTGKDDPKENANKGWSPNPWEVKVDGLVRNPLTLSPEQIIKKVGGIEQRVYRFRCVEAWSMVVPWDGFQLSKLIQMVEPLSDAKFVKFYTFDKPRTQWMKGGYIDWPYIEGLTMQEAMNELTFMATGLYGKNLPNQNGAPMRLVVPWKYGFKSIKSIVRIEFTNAPPLNTWQALQPREYGFYANVNPNVDHPRWSQASERVLGAGFLAGRQPTILFNGYTRQVGEMYKDMDLKVFF